MMMRPRGRDFLSPKLHESFEVMVSVIQMMILYMLLENWEFRL